MGLVHSNRDSRTPNCFTLVLVLVLLSYTKIQILPFLLLLLVLLPFLFTLSSSSSSPKIQNSTSLFTSTLLTQHHKLPEAFTSHLTPWIFVFSRESSSSCFPPTAHVTHPSAAASTRAVVYSSCYFHLCNSNHHHHHHHHPQLPSRLQSNFRWQHLKLLLQDYSSF